MDLTCGGGLLCEVQVGQVVDGEAKRFCLDWFDPLRDTTRSRDRYLTGAFENLRVWKLVVS